MPGDDGSVLLVTPSEERRDAATAALRDVGQIVWARDVGQALEEVSLERHTVALVDDDLPGDGVAEVVGAFGEPGRVIVWVPELRTGLLEYGAYVQIPYRAEPEILAGAVVRLLNHRRLEEEVERCRRREDHIDRLIDVVSHVRHEMNNPLTSLLAETQLLLMDPNPMTAEQKQGVETIQAMARRMRDLVKRLQEVKLAG